MKLLSWSLVVSLSASVALAATAGAGDLEPASTAFDADMSIVSDGQTVTGHIWYDSGLERREMTVQGRAMTVFVRPDQDLVFFLPDGVPVAMRMPLAPEFRYHNIGLLKGMELDPIGPETVNGQAATKYGLAGVTLLDEPMEGHVWVTDDGIVMQLAGRAQIKGAWINATFFLENLAREKPSPDMFELGEDIQVVDR
jgi:hypothetical protein